MKHRLLICTTCLAAIQPDRISPHLKQHAKSLPAIEHDILRGLFSYFNIRTDMPANQENGIAPIEGISVVKGYICSMCSCVFPNPDQLRSHAKSNHPTGVLEAHAIQNSFPAQRIRTGRNVRYFVVKPKEKAAELNSLDLATEALSDLLKPAAIRDSVSASADIRNVCPWLRYTHWQDLLDGRNIAEVRRSVAYPSEDEFPGIAQAIFAVFLKASEYFNGTSDLILQHINSPDENQ
jgi:hypothetical protein